MSRGLAGPPHTGARTPLALSVCCVTHAPPAQTRAALASLDGVAGEIVVAVDDRQGAPTEEYAAFADRVIRVPTGIVETNLAAVHAACSQEWILRLDSDEAVSPALLARLPALLAEPDVRQYAFARRCLVDGGEAWIDEEPWWPDFQVRLVRAASARFSTVVHQPVASEEPRVLVVEPLLHFDCVLHTPLERQAKILRYEATKPEGPGTLRTQITRLFEPERFARRPPVALEGEELAASRRFLAIAADAPLPDRVASATAAPVAARSHGEVQLEALERDTRFERGVHRNLAVRVTNTGAETWGANAQLGATGGWFVSYHWRWPDAPEVEGKRTPLPETLAPGDACVANLYVVPPERAGAASLELGLVREHVRWAAGTLPLAADVVEPAALPERRERRAPGSAPIPRVFHQVWLGDRPLPAAHAAHAESWRRLHPEWEFRLWTDADAPRPEGIERARNLAERADLVRYELLRLHGGVYVDTDVECLRPFDELLEGVTAFAAYEVPGRLCNAVLGAVPGHEAFRRATDLAAITVGTGTYPEATATSFLTYVLEALPDVTLFGPERFYPELWDGTANAGAEAPYARHHWAKAWQEESA